MAFQPIIDVVERKILAQEALVRGAAGEGAGVVLSQISDESRYAFDQLCRTTAIDLAARLGLADDGALLSINFLPNAV
jgi:EAL domain-containing protein (putative c-di-GMP-specific phosphodiesterase class I)